MIGDISPTEKRSLGTCIQVNRQGSLSKNQENQKYAMGLGCIYLFYIQFRLTIYLIIN